MHGKLVNYYFELNGHSRQWLCGPVFLSAMACAPLVIGHALCSPVSRIDHSFLASLKLLQLFNFYCYVWLDPRNFAPWVMPIQNHIHRIIFNDLIPKKVTLKIPF